MAIIPPDLSLRRPGGLTRALLDDEALPQRCTHVAPMDPHRMLALALFGGMFFVCYQSWVQSRCLLLTGQEKTRVRRRLALILTAYVLSVAGAAAGLHATASPAVGWLALVTVVLPALGQFYVNGALETGRRRSLALRGPLWELEGEPHVAGHFLAFILLFALNTILLTWLGVG